MNITEFAEQIVFGKTLEEKLQRPGRLSYDADRAKRVNVDALRQPSRPYGMAMQPVNSPAVAPPSDQQLENETARGKLLHYLANHELLATELMALVLLKFPDAPAAFRQGVLVTLQEEQDHTRMYLQRMNECGVEFGSFPLSGQFWRMVEPMRSPLDFVSRLSLTFEQANLDYSKHFAQVFRRIGDDATAKVLQQIYEDEISHVQHGLHWFRQWKDPAHSDWDAYRHSLSFPMSPLRGKGPSVAFNREGRLRAGLEPAFVDSIEVFHHSRGRAATLRWFDPGAESELAGNASHREQALLDRLARDLENVMLPLAKSEDIFLVRQLPGRDLQKHWRQAGFTLPEFHLFDDCAALTDRRLHDMAPWAWTPQAHAVATPLRGTVRHAPPPWQDSQRDLFRKSWSANKLLEWLQQPDTPEWFVSPSAVGQTVTTVDGVREGLQRLARSGWREALFKTDLATSGRGQRRLRTDQPPRSEDVAAIESSLQVGPAVIEPALQRLLDLSFLWQPDSNAGSETVSRFVGWTRPLVAANHRYTGTRLGDLFSDCDSEIKRFLLADRCARLNYVMQWLSERLLPALQSQNFAGPFGVDALLCRSNDGSLQVKPVVELNPRTTMGHVALHLQKRLAPGVQAEFRVLTRNEWTADESWVRDQTIATTATGHWKSGVVHLSDIDQRTKLVPLVIVGDVLERRKADGW